MQQLSFSAVPSSGLRLAALCLLATIALLGQLAPAEADAAARKSPPPAKKTAAVAYTKPAPPPSSRRGSPYPSTATTTTTNTGRALPPGFPQDLYGMLGNSAASATTAAGTAGNLQAQVGQQAAAYAGLQQQLSGTNGNEFSLSTVCDLLTILKVGSGLASSVSNPYAALLTGGGSASNAALITLLEGSTGGKIVEQECSKLSPGYGSLAPAISGLIGNSSDFSKAIAGLASSYDQTQAKAKASRVPSYLQATNVGKVRRIPFTDTPASGRPAPAGLGDYLQATNAGKLLMTIDGSSAAGAASSAASAGSNLFQQLVDSYAKTLTGGTGAGSTLVNALGGGTGAGTTLANALGATGTGSTTLANALSAAGGGNALVNALSGGATGGGNSLVSAFDGASEGNALGTAAAAGAYLANALGGGGGGTSIGGSGTKNSDSSATLGAAAVGGYLANALGGGGDSTGTLGAGLLTSQLAKAYQSAAAAAGGSGTGTSGSQNLGTGLLTSELAKAYQSATAGGSSGIRRRV